MTTELVDRLADVLARIIDDHMVVVMLLERDPQAWADAVSILAEVEGYEPEPRATLQYEQP